MAAGGLEEPAHFGEVLRLFTSPDRAARRRREGRRRRRQVRCGLLGFAGLQAGGGKGDGELEEGLSRKMRTLSNSDSHSDS